MNLTGSVDVGAKPFRRIVRTGNVIHARVVGNVSHLLNEIVGTGVIPTMTRSSRLRPTIEYKLDGQINVVTLTKAGDLK